MNKYGWESTEGYEYFDGYLEEWRCSKCGETFYLREDEIDRYIYCPSCGLQDLPDV